MRLTEVLVVVAKPRFQRKTGTGFFFLSSPGAWINTESWLSGRKRFTANEVGLTAS